MNLSYEPPGGYRSNSPALVDSSMNAEATGEEGMILTCNKYPKKPRFLFLNLFIHLQKPRKESKLEGVDDRFGYPYDSRTSF